MVERNTYEYLHGGRTVDQAVERRLDDEREPVVLLKQAHPAEHSIVRDIVLLGGVVTFNMVAGAALIATDRARSLKQHLGNMIERSSNGS